MSLEAWMTRRALSKVRNGEVGRPYAAQQLVAFGADDPESVVNLRYETWAKWLTRVVDAPSSPVTYEIPTRLSPSRLIAISLAPFARSVVLSGDRKSPSTHSRARTTMRRAGPATILIGIDQVKAHPRNVQIYGDTADQDMIDSIRKVGILESLVVANDYTIIIGHRRWAAAKELGLQLIPVEVRTDLTDELEILEALIHGNKARTKTNELIVREGEVLEEIEWKRALARMHEGGEKGRQQQRTGVAQGPQDPGPDPKGQLRDKIGEAIGISGKSYERGKKVVKEIDRADAEGDNERADHLRETLNTKSFKPAAEQATTPSKATQRPVGRRPLPKHEGCVTMDEWNAMSKEEHGRYTPYVLLAAKARKKGKRRIVEPTGKLIPLPDGQEPLTWDEFAAMVASEGEGGDAAAA
jgi:ParB-like chromosome segregation protein Spo0J